MPREQLKVLPPIRFSFSACRSRGSANRLEMLQFEISSFSSIARWQSSIEFDYIPANDFLAISLTKIRDGIKKKSEWEEVNIFFISWGFIWVRFVRSKSHRAGLKIPRAQPYGCGFSWMKMKKTKSQFHCYFCFRLQRVRARESARPRVLLHRRESQ